MTLGHLMTRIEYSSQLGIWAKSWNKDSPARIVQIYLENGGVQDDWIYVSDGVHLGDSRAQYTDNDPDFDKDWIDYYLDKYISISNPMMW